MFSKAKSKKKFEEKPAQKISDTEPRSVKSANASTTSNSKASAKRASNMKSPGVPSIISADVILEGNVTSNGEVQFDGTLTGNIRAASLIIGEKATVKGEVACDAVTVRGRVEGMVRARNVSLASTAHIEGDIMHSSLSVEPGAHFDGNCRHSDDPLADDAAKAFDRPTGNSRPSPRPAPTQRPASALDADTNLAATPDPGPSNTPAPTSNGSLDNGRSFDDAFSGQNAERPVATPQQQESGASAFLAKNRSPLR